MIPIHCILQSLSVLPAVNSPGQWIVFLAIGSDANSFLEDPSMKLTGFSSEAAKTAFFSAKRKK